MDGWEFLCIIDDGMYGWDLWWLCLLEIDSEDLKDGKLGIGGFWNEYLIGRVFKGVYLV